MTDYKSQLRDIFSGKTTDVSSGQSSSSDSDFMNRLKKIVDSQPVSQKAITNKTVGSNTVNTQTEPIQQSNLEFLDYDFESAEKEIDRLKKLKEGYNEDSGYKQQLRYNSQYTALKNMGYSDEDADAKAREITSGTDYFAGTGYNSYEELTNDLSNKNREYNLNKRNYDAYNLSNDAVSSPDFVEYSKKGNDIENPTQKQAEGFLTIGGGFMSSDNDGIHIGGKTPGNIVTYSRDNYDNIHVGGAGMVGDEKYHWMTDNEVNIYNYYLAKENEGLVDKGTAQTFLDSINESLNARVASGRFETLENDIALEMLFAVESGGEQFRSGMRNFVNGVVGGEESIDTSAIQYASQMAREDLSDVGFNVLGNSVGQMAYDTITTTTNMIPSIMLSTAANAVVPGSGQILGAGLLGVSASGNAYQDMVNAGYSADQARAYAVINGVSEAGLEYLICGVGKLGGKLTGVQIEKIASGLKNAGLRIAVQYGGEMLSEGIEEGLQEFLDPYFKAIATGEYADDVDWNAVWYSALLGAISSLPLNVASNVGANASAKSQYGSSQADIVAEGLTYDENSTARMLAENGQKKLDKNKNLSGRALREMVGANFEASVSKDKATIQSETAKRLKSLGETGNINEIASGIAKMIAGENLTVSESKAVQNGKYAQRVLNELNPKNIRSGQYDTAWAESLDTKRINPIEYGFKTRADIIKDELVASKANVSQDQIKEKVSESGKTEVGGSESSIKNITQTDDGKMALTMDDGTVVDSADISYASKDEALLYEYAMYKSQSAETANAIVNGYKSSDGISVSDYLLGLDEAYNYGKINYPISSIRNDGFVSYLTESQIDMAYKLGQDDSVTTTSNKQNSLNKNKTTTGKKGTVKIPSHLRGNLTDIQKQSILTVGKVVTEITHNDVVFYESVLKDGKRVFAYDIAGKRAGESAPNGFYVSGNGAIYIDINAGQNGEGVILWTAAHEMTHFIREWSPEKFKTLADFLIGEYGKNGVNVNQLIYMQMQKAKNSGHPISYDTAYEEVVADSMSSMFTDTNMLEKLKRLKAKDNTLFGKLKKLINDLYQRVRSVYSGLKNQSTEANLVKDMADSLEHLSDLFAEALVDAGNTYQYADISNTSSIEASKVEEMTSGAKSADGSELFQYRAMENDIPEYRAMLEKYGTEPEEIDRLFGIVEKVMDKVKENLEILDYDWEMDINDRAFNPVKPNSDSLYKYSVDFSTLCRKRILQQIVQMQLQSALDRAVTREESIAIRNELMKIQAEGREIEVACALCYVESARMKSPAQIQKFLDNRRSIITEFFAGKDNGETKKDIQNAEDITRERLSKEYAKEIASGEYNDPASYTVAKNGKHKPIPLKQLPGFMKKEIQDAKKKAKQAYVPTEEESKLLDIADRLTTSDFTSPEGLEKLIKDYPRLFDAYTSFVRNATKSKGLEKDTWWRAGDSFKVGDDLITAMNKENGLRTQSWSDFQVIHTLDYIAAIIELSTRGAKMQAYTKVADYVKLMGNTNQMINLSLIPNAVFKGILEYDSVEGMDFNKALELRDKYPATAGTICIGVNNKQIKMLLDSDLIDYVIPYHQSGMSKVLRKAMHIPTWMSYESFQNETQLDGLEAEELASSYGVELIDKSSPMWHKKPSFSEWFNAKQAQKIADKYNAMPDSKLTEHQKEMKQKYGVMFGGYVAMQMAADNYLKLCAKRGLNPVFSHPNADFTTDDNYWKLLIDRKMINNKTGEIIEQKAVKPIFNEEDVLQILQDEVDRYPGVQADQNYATKTVVNKFLSGEMVDEVKAIEKITGAVNKAVDDVTKVSILESANEVKNSERVSNKEIAQSEDEYALYIKNTDKANYIGMILRGTKTVETRGSRTLDAFIGREMPITDGKYVYGYMTIGEPYKISAKDFHSKDNQKKHRVPKGDEYDVKDGKYKWAYPIESVRKVEKQKLSDSTDYKYSFQAREVLYQKYSYNELNKLPDIIIHSDSEYKFRSVNYSRETKRSDVISAARYNIEEYNKGKNNYGSKYLYSNALGYKVMLTNDSFKHGLRKMKNSEANAYATIYLPLYFENSIVVNEADGMRNNADSSYILMGMYERDNAYYVVRTVVNKYTHEVEDIGEVYAIASKKEAVDKSTLVKGKSLAEIPLKISVSDFVEIIKNYYPFELSKEIKKRYGIKGKSDFDGIRYSDRNTATFNGKEFWSGAVNLSDGVIEEVHSIDEAKNSDWHHSLYFSDNAVEKIDDGEWGFFYVDENGNIQGDWRDSIHKEIIKKIESQIRNKKSYSYNSLVKKPGIKGNIISENVKMNGSEIDIEDIDNKVKSKCKTIVNPKNGKITYYLECDDIDGKIEITNRGINHSSTNKKGNNKSSNAEIINARATLDLPNVLKNAIEVNVSERKNNSDVLSESILLGTVGFRDGNNINYYVVKIIVENRKNNSRLLKSYDVTNKLYSVNAKKIDQANVLLTLQGANSTYAGRFEISIKDLIYGVNSSFNDIFSNDVYSELGKTRKETKDTKYLLYSDRILMGSEFSGGGLLEAGLVYQMLDKEFAVEYDENIAAVYRDNWGDHIYAGKDDGDVMKFDISKHKDIFYFHASPVCHDYSKAKHGTKELKVDLDSARKVAHDIEVAMPEVFTLENAPFYVTSKALKIITDKLNELGYQVRVGVYNSADYGSATSRERCIVTAVKSGTLPDVPTKMPRTNTWDAVTRDLWDGLKNARTRDGKPKALNESYKSAFLNTKKLFDSTQPNHVTINSDGTINIRKPLLLLQTTSGHEVTFAWEGTQCPTLTTKCGESRLILPGANISLDNPNGNIKAVTPQFMGNIQGLPEDYNYGKAKTRAFTIVGNGIPTHLTKAVIGSVLDSAYEQTHDGKKLYSERDSSSQDTRTILSNALSDTATTEVDKKIISDYQQNIERINAEQTKLAELRRQIKELSFGTGKRDVEQIKKLQDEATKTANRINIYDKKLLKLEATKPLQDVLTREKAKARKKAQEEGKKALAEYKKVALERQQEIVDKYKERQKAGVERRQNTELRNKIKKLIDDLNSMELNPKVNRYVPENLMKPVSDILMAINTDSGRSEKLTAKLAELKVKYDAISSDPRYANAYDEAVSDMIQALTENIGDTSIYNMTREQLMMTYNTLKALTHVIRTAVKVRNIETEKNAYEISRAMREETNDVKKASSSVFTRWLQTSLRPQTMFERFAGFKKNSMWSKVYDMLNRGQLKQMQIEMEANAIFNKVFEDEEYVKSLSDTRNLVDIGLTDDDGNTVMITRGMALAIYKHLMNDDNARHIMIGGLTVPELKKYYKGSDDAYGVGHIVIHGIGANGLSENTFKLNEAKKRLDDAEMTGADEFTIEAIKSEIESLYDERSEIVADGEAFIDSIKNNIKDILTDKDRAFLEAAYELFDVYSKKRLNETTMELYGFEKAQVQNYLPIHTDPNFRQASFEQITKDFNLENSGFMKDRVNATNPIVLEDLAEIINRQISNVARYCGMTIPIKDFGKIYGKSDSGFASSLQDTISNKFGTPGKKYIENLLSDIVGSRSGETTFLDRARGYMAGATLSINPRVALAQAASLPTAASEIGWKPIMKASNMFLKAHDLELISQYSPLLYNRSNGANIEASDIKSMSQVQNRVMRKLDWLMGWIEAMDKRTVGTLWYASQYYVQENYRGIETDSEEYYMKVAEVFNRVVERTQPNYTTLQRPDILRNPNAVVKQLTMFMTQRLQNFNIVYEASEKYTKYKDDLKNKKNGITEEDVQEAGSSLANAVSSQIVASVTIVAMKFLVDAMMHNMNGYRDDDDELTAGSIFASLFDGLLDTTVSNLLGGSELFSVLKSIITGDKYYGISLSGVDAYSDAISQFVKTVQNPDLSSCHKLAKSVCVFMGIPLNNAEKIGLAIYYHVSDIVNGQFGSFESGVERNASQNVDRSYNAYVSGDMTKFKSIEVKQSDVTRVLKPKYLEAYKNKDNTTMTNIRKYMNATKLYKKDVSEITQGWVKSSK